MKRTIIALLILLTATNANNTKDIKIAEYEQKANYHQYGTKELDIALEYHKKSCELNDGIACSNVASMYYNGYGEHKSNKQEAFNYYKKACDLDNGYACTATAMFYEQGLTTKKDFKQALYYYKKGCRLHNKVACDTLNSLRNMK